MLYALGRPIDLLLLLLSYVAVVTLHGWVSALASRRAGAGDLGGSARTSPDPRRHIDPFGAVAAAIAGLGWAKPVPPPGRRRRGARALALLAGPVSSIALGLGVLAVSRLTGGPTLSGALVSALQQGVGAQVDLGHRALVLFGLCSLFLGVLSLVPLPPLNGGQLLFGLAPQTAGWRQVEYQLVERNIGTAVLLALLLIPLGGPTALVPRLLDIVVSPLATAVLGG